MLQSIQTSSTEVEPLEKENFDDFDNLFSGQHPLPTKVANSLNRLFELLATQNQTYKKAKQEKELQLANLLIHHVIEGNHNYVAHLLVQLADPNAKCELGDTALIWAISKNDSQMVGLLLKFLADPNMPGQNSETPLTWAARLGDQDIMSHLIAHGATVTNWPAWEEQMRDSEYSTEEPELIEDKIKSTKLFIEQAMAIKQQAAAAFRWASLLEELFLPDWLEQPKVIISSDFNERAYKNLPNHYVEETSEHKYPQPDSEMENHKRQRTNLSS